MLVGGHYRSRSESRDRWLAYRQHMRAGADVFEVADHIVDVIVQIELTSRQRDHLGIGPVGHIDFVGFQHPLDRAAQQRGEVAAHRRDDQQAGGIFGQAGVGKAQQVAERLMEHDRFGHRMAYAVHFDAFDIEGRLAIGCRSMGEHFERRGHHVSAGAVAER